MLSDLENLSLLHSNQRSEKQLNSSVMEILDVIVMVSAD